MAVSKNNFFKDHYDWLVAIFGLALLAGAGFLFASSQENTPEAAVEAIKATVPRNPAHKDVPAAATELLDSVTNSLKNPPKIADQGKTTRGFLTSEPRVYCQVCHRPIPAGSEKCTWVVGEKKCGASQSSEKEDFSQGDDRDGDGMIDDWERKYKLDPRDASDKDKDPDGDTFTNLEEFTAKTDPRDPNSHPNFLDFLSLAGTLRTEELPFLLTQETPLRNGYRLTFVAAKKNQKNQPVIGDAVVTRSGAPAEVGKEIVFKLERPKFVKGKMQDDKVNTGWRVKDYKKDEKLVDVPGSDGLKKPKNTSIAQLERISDGRTISVQIHEAKPVAVEEQVDLVWSRGDGKPFTVTKGSKFKLKNREYEVKKLAKEGNACKVTILDLETKEEKIIQ